MRRYVVGGIVGIAALVASVALALLGRAVLATPSTLERTAPGWPAGVQSQAVHRSLADRAGASLLAADRNDAFTRIVAIYRDAVALQAAAGDPRGPVRISRLIPKLRSSAERAQALTMAGTLLAYSAGAGFGVILPGRAQAPTQTVLGQAVADFREAVRSDPTDEAAKYDLELLLRQQRKQRQQPQRNRTQRKTPTTQDTRRKTAPTSGQEHHAGIYATGSGY